MPRRRHVEQANIEPADQRGAPGFGIAQRLRQLIRRRAVRTVDDDPAEQGGDAAELRSMLARSAMVSTVNVQAPRLATSLEMILSTASPPGRVNLANFSSVPPGC